MNKNSCKELERIAFHEAGHFVIGISNLFGEPSYEGVELISIESTGSSLGRVVGMTYYKEVYENGYMQGQTIYPEHENVKNCDIEKLKLKKEAIKDLGGRLAEYFFCGKEKPDFKYDKDEGSRGDLWKFSIALRCIYGYLEDEEFVKKCEEFWQCAIDIIKKNKDIKDNLIFVKDKLLEEKTIEGKKLQQLINKIA